MIYAGNITTPANTAQSNLKTTRISVTKGLVYKVEFYFPAGSQGLMGVAVFDGLFQTWPSSVGTFFLGDDMQISFDDLYLMDSAPYEFQVYTYNEDDTYDHLVSVRVGLVSREIYLARFLPAKTDEYMIKLIAELVAEQEARARLQREQLEQTVFEFLASQTSRELRKQKKADRRERRERRESTGFKRLQSGD